MQSVLPAVAFLCVAACACSAPPAPQPGETYPNYNGVNGVVFENGPLDGATVDFGEVKAHVEEELYEDEDTSYTYTDVDITCESAAPVHQGTYTMFFLSARGDGKPGEYRVNDGGRVMLYLDDTIRTMDKGRIVLTEIGPPGGVVRGTFRGSIPSLVSASAAAIKVGGAFTAVRVK